MIIQATISDSKEIFHREFPYVIPPLYRRLADELLVELHLLGHQKDFHVNPIFSIGLTELFDVFTKGYEPEKHKSELFRALCQANSLNYKDLNNQSQELLKRVKGLPLDNLKTIIKEEYRIGESKEIYSRITAIGLYKLIQITQNNNDQSEKEEEDSINLKEISNLYGYESDRASRDIKIYTSNILKMKQALEIIELNVKKK